MNDATRAQIENVVADFFGIDRYQFEFEINPIRLCWFDRPLDSGYAVYVMQAGQDWDKLIVDTNMEPICVGYTFEQQLIDDSDSDSQ
jgi:hypothetical protein